MHPERPYLVDLDPQQVPSPCFVVDVEALERNGRILGGVQKASGAKVLLALKGFALTAAFPWLKPHLSGTCASSPHEARLGKEHFGKEVHTYSPAFTPESLEACLQYSDHIVFNSVAQVKEHSSRVRGAGGQVGLRLNPRHSEGEVELYDPCAPRSRLGAVVESLKDLSPQAIDGLHIHTLCEQGVDALERTVSVLERDFSIWLEKVRWLNLGGGHHITQPGYEIHRLIDLLGHLKERYDLQLYLEPGEAAAIHSGAFVTRVLDLTHNEVDIAILDASVTCHLPDVLEMPYRAEIRGAGQPGEHPHHYRLGGQSCLAGDVAGDYSFVEPLRRDQALLFEDMSHYTMVKTTTFNGVPLPSIALWHPREQRLEVVRRFSYDDFLQRLG